MGVEVLGLRWSGFREVTRDIGEWAGETELSDLEDLARATLRSAPDVVVTHARPAHVLERERMNHDGVPGFIDSSARWHFFGHEHATGGQSEVVGATTYINSACQVRIHDLEL